MNLRVQLERVRLSQVMRAHGPAGGLRRAEIDARIGGCVAAVFIENQVAGLEVDGILERLGRRLIQVAGPFRIGFEVDLHLALGDDVARFRIISKVVARDLVEAGRIASVEHDVHVLQVGVAVELELLDVAGADGEDGASRLRF